MRIAVCGVGRIGAFHAQTLTSVPGVDDVIVSDIDTERAGVIADRLGVRAAGSVGSLLPSPPRQLVERYTTEPGFRCLVSSTSWPEPARLSLGSGPKGTRHDARHRRRCRSLRYP